MTTSRPATFRRLTLVPAIFLAAFMSHACGEAPATPSPLPSLDMPLSQRPFDRLAGNVVDERGTPVAGALLTFFDQGKKITQLTDVNGSFEVFISFTTVPGIEVLIEKPGFERTTHFINFRKTIDILLRLPSIVSLTAGSSLRLQVSLDDPSCGFSFEFVCRTIRVRAPATGRITLDVVPDRFNARLGLVLSSELIPQLTTTRLVLHVDSGTIVPIDVLLWWESTHSESFQLTSQIMPD